MSHVTAHHTQSHSLWPVLPRLLRHASGPCQTKARPLVPRSMTESGIADPGHVHAKLHIHTVSFTADPLSLLIVLVWRVWDVLLECHMHSASQIISMRVWGDVFYGGGVLPMWNYAYLGAITCTCRSGFNSLTVLLRFGDLYPMPSLGELCGIAVESGCLTDHS